MIIPLSRLTRLCLLSSFVVSTLVHADSSMNIAPSVELQYTIKATQKGIPVSGEALVKWLVSGQKNTLKYSLTTETHVMLFGKILEANSFGSINGKGLAPDLYVEKRFGKAESKTTFDHATNTIRFTDSSASYPIKGSEQDRSSATWQLVTLARTAENSFQPGSQVTMFVAGRRDAEPWTFKVTGIENLTTAIGEFSTVHLIKAPPPDSKEQQLEIWLAPTLEWYPVRVKFSDGDGDKIDQLITGTTITAGANRVSDAAAGDKIKTAD
jgi:hypothetical protein